MDPIVDVDKIWKALGVWRPYQVFQLVYLYICTIPVAYPVLSWVFIGYTPPFRCKNLSADLSTYRTGLQGNVSDFHIEYRQCDLTISPTNTTPRVSGLDTPRTYSCLNGYEYDHEGGVSVIMEWSLVCSRSGLGEMSTTVVMVGMCLGAALFTSLADRYGRKRVAVCIFPLLLVTTLALAFMPIFSAFVVVRLIIGAFQQGFGLSTAIIVIEMFPLEWRGFLGFIGAVNWSLCVCTMLIFGYFMQNLSWRYFQIATALVSFHSLVAPWILDESLRWLIANKKYSTAERIIKKAAKWNRRDPQKILSLLRLDTRELIVLADDRLADDRLADDRLADDRVEANINGEEATAYVPESCARRSAMTSLLQTPTESSDSVTRYNFLDILKNRILLRNSLILWYTWVVNSGVYYGLFLTSNSLSGNRFLNFFINSLVEIPGAAFYLLIINRVGRKYTSVIMHGLAGVSLIASVLIHALSQQDGDVASVVSLIFNYAGKLCISASFLTIFIYTPELYPTNLRNVGIGIASAAGRIGGMMSPFSSILSSYAAWGPGVLFGCCCLLAMFLMFFLPETSGYILPQTIEELEVWNREQSFFRRYKKKNDEQSQQNKNKT